MMLSPLLDAFSFRSSLGGLGAASFFLSVALGRLPLPVGVETEAGPLPSRFQPSWSFFLLCGGFGVRGELGAKETFGGLERCVPLPAGSRFSGDDMNSSRLPEVTLVGADVGPWGLPGHEGETVAGFGSDPGYTGVACTGEPFFCVGGRPVFGSVGQHPSERGNARGRHRLGSWDS